MTAAEVATVGRALGHPLRVRLVERLAIRRAQVLDEHGGSGIGLDASAFALSPSGLANQLGDGSSRAVSALSYHVRILHELGAIALVGQEPRRGALEHFYALTPLGRTVADMAARLAR